MAHDLEEQEKVEELKAWWKQHGGFITALILAVALGFAGWQAWRWYEANQAAQASVLYDTVTKAAQANDAKALRDAAGTLVESYPRTLYASMGALVGARYYFDRNDLKNAALRGDVLLAKNQAAEAKAAYKLALEKADDQDGAFRESVRMRLEALGG